MGFTNLTILYCTIFINKSIIANDASSDVTARKNNKIKEINEIDDSSYRLNFELGKYRIKPSQQL